GVVDDLGVDVLGAAEDRQARPLRAAGDAQSQALMPLAAQRVPRVLLDHLAPPPLPALPALRRICSPAYRIPLPLYGSGLRRERMKAAVCPTSSLSAPTTARRVGVSTWKLIPSGGSISTGCE